jgi:hypothetical protein
MVAKNIESLRQKMGSKLVVRLFRTKPFIDDKWVDDPKDIKDYMVVRYKKESDAYLPVWKIIRNKKVQWWESEDHKKIKDSIKEYNKDWDRVLKDKTKASRSKDLFIREARVERFHSDNFKEAQEKYIGWLAEDKSFVKPLMVGRLSGDD